MPKPFPTLSERSTPGEFFVGLTLPFTAMRLIFSSPKLLGLAVLSAFVTAGVLVGILWGWWPVSDALAQKVIHGNDWWQTALHGLLRFIVYAALVAVSALTLPHLVLAPLQDPLSEAADVACGDFTPPPFSWSSLLKGTLLSASHSLLRIAILFAGVLVLLPLHLIPLVGSVAYTALAMGWSAWWGCAEYLSGPMARHFLPFSAVRAAMNERRWLSFGFGAALTLLLWVPVVNFFLVPLAVVSGTLLYRSLQAKTPGT